ncbi:MAG: 23S rRNA (uracil(1939)-C(5))-methyltransferase RlmD [Odoribacteraceae bacterium]|jgi:23S rRNA (uracil1939-C5)-methyltransferase|nr:23S rRNA (uracil(1939)-C(5))-methyltransferase RlmD [Odoribacteraceae bacterium]
MKKPLLENVEIQKIAAGGKSIALVDGKVLFVPNTVPGDVVDVQVTRKRSSFMEGYTVNVKRYSPARVEPFCAHFGTCGGCKWQHLPYDAQTRFKQEEVEETLRRVGKVELRGVAPIIGSPRTREYRNKLEFTFSDRRYLTREEIAAGTTIERSPALGFHAPGLFDKVVDIERCHLQAEPSNAIRAFTRRQAIARGLSFYSIREKRGLLRTLIIRTTSTGEVMVIVVFGEDRRARREELLHAIAGEFPGITSLLYTVNEKGNDTITDLDVITYRGAGHLLEEMEGLRFKIGPKSFYQTNPGQALNLYRKTRELAGLTGNEVVYDLYTGTGTIAHFVARDARLVVGVENVPEAIADARENSLLNGITNTRFLAGDMKEVLNETFFAAHGRPDVIITDPPRAGMHAAVIEAITRAAPARVVYVSCNPATQARDIQAMHPAYRVTAVQPVDMFPHTHHVESIVLLQREDDSR